MHLNYLPLRFTSDAFDGSVLTFPARPKDSSVRDSELSIKLRELRQQHGKTYFFYASGNTIACVPFTQNAPFLGAPKRFTIVEDFQLANALARNALFEFFKSANHTVVDHRPVTVLLHKHNLASARQDVFGIFPEYSLDVRPLAPHEGRITSGVLVGFAIRHVFLKTVAELLKDGVILIGLYAVRPQGGDDEAGKSLDRRYLGRIESISDDGTVRLTDSDFAEFPVSQCYLEGSRGNVEVVGNALLKAGYQDFSDKLHAETFRVMGAEHQVRRLREIGTWLEKQSPIACCEGLAIRVHQKPHECPKGNDAGTTHSFNSPSCVLRPGGSITVPWPVDKQIDQHGPYDAESFPEKRVRIAIICPQEFVGDVGPFFRQFKDGVQSSDERLPFRQGFVRKYHLNSCDFSFHELKRSSNIEESYRTAALDALKEKPHLAVAIIREQYRDLPDSSNPYYTTKARMMSQGVPVQLVEIETIRHPGTAYTLNNLGLAMYAKLGGIPWTLTPNQDLAHEIVVGIGSARLSNSRRGAGERVIGITTVFSGDGQYLLANNTREVSSDQYLDTLTSSLHETVAELRSRFGWKTKDRVRFVFHQSYKKYKDVEAEAVQRFAQSLNDFDVQYAFVHVSDSHNWMLFDPGSEGVKWGKSLKGKWYRNEVNAFLLVLTLRCLHSPGHIR